MKKMIGKGFAEMMVYTCDGCHRQERGMRFRGAWHIPPGWYSIGDEFGDHAACSTKCARIVAGQFANSEVSDDSSPSPRLV